MIIQGIVITDTRHNIVFCKIKDINSKTRIIMVKAKQSMALKTIVNIDIIENNHLILAKIN